MRWSGIACLAHLALLSTNQASAASDMDVLKQFGMLGHVAVDCSAPYSIRNPHLIFTADADGNVTRTLRMTRDPDTTTSMRNLRMVGPATLQYEEADRQSEMTISIIKQANGTFRSWRSVRTNGPKKGEVLIADGRFPEGTETVAFTFCGLEDVQPR